MVITDEFYPCPVWSGEELIWAVCGYRYGRFLIIKEFVEVWNSSDTPEDTFSVTAEDLALATSHLPESMRVLGFMHNHPDDSPAPSKADIEGIRDYSFGIVLCQGRYQWYDGNGTIVVKEVSSTQ